MNIYLDCGYYAGLALRDYIDQGIVDDTWTMYAFDPSPLVDDYLDRPWTPKNFIKKAVWIRDGKIKFNVSRRENASSIKGITGQVDPEEIEVDCINFSKFVKGLPEAYIFCSMDMEGAEFKVLKKMLKDNTIDKINKLSIEFHYRLMLDYDKTDAEDLIKQIEARGVEVILKEPLS